MPARPAVTVRLNGLPVAVDSVRVGTDSPVDLHLPPRPGEIAGSDATVRLSTRPGATYRPEVPWSPLWRVRPGAAVEVDVDGARAFTGVVDKVPASLRNPDLTLSCIDPLGQSDKTFWAPALLERLSALPDMPNSRGVGLYTLWYVDKALQALGAWSSAPVTKRTMFHASMVGSAFSELGTIREATRYDTTVDAPAYPTQDLLSARLEGAEVARVGMQDPYILGTSAPWPTDPTYTHTLIHELNPDPAPTNYHVKALGPGSKAGFGIWVFNGSVSVRGWTATGAVDVSDPLTPLDPENTRIIVRYTPATGVITWRLRGNPDTRTLTLTAPVASLASTATADVEIYGRGVVGAVSHRRGGVIPNVLPHPELDAPYGVSWDIPATRTFRRRILGHPAIVDEPAVPFIVGQAAREMAFVYTDPEGVVHWSDPKAWDDLPVAHTITDGPTGGLDDVLVAVNRRGIYARVRVLGKRVQRFSTGVNRHKPTVDWARVTQQVSLQAGDEPVQLFLKPDDNVFWVGEPDLALRQAGVSVDPAQPWQTTTDFERGRGSWVGGHVQVAGSSSVRWARDQNHPEGPADFTWTAERLGADTILVTLTPGPGLAPGDTFINLPSPASPLMQTAPHLAGEYLPVIRGPQTGTITDIDGVSADFADATEDSPEYVHDAGLAIQRPLYEQAAILAQDMADRYVGDLGQVTVECAPDAAYRIGQRVHIEPRSRSDVTLDGVIVGIPDLSVSTTDAHMTLRVWVRAVVMHSITYGERAAMLAPGSTYGASTANGPTYAGERAAALADATTAANTN